MSHAQTSYQETHDIGLHGTIAEGTMPKTIRSYECGEADGIGFGLALKLSATDADGCILGVDLNPVGQVNGAINNSATTLVIDSTDVINVGDRLVIGSEIVLVTARNANNTNLTIVRGAHGSAAAAIVDNAPVYLYPREGANYIGISLADPHRLNDEYPEGSMVGTISQGTIHLEVATAVAVGDPVTADATTGVIAGEDPTASLIPIPNARWLSDAAASGIALLQLGQNN